MDLHYSQTKICLTNTVNMFESPMDLHYSQTLHPLQFGFYMFESPMDLHYSQTRYRYSSERGQFESPMDLHYSQTSNSRKRSAHAAYNPQKILILSNNYISHKSSSIIKRLSFSKIGYSLFSRKIA